MARLIFVPLYLLCLAVWAARKFSAPGTWRKNTHKR
jgi:hypothetical protein